MCHQINQLPASFSWSHRNKFVQNSFCGLSKALRTFAPHWTTPWEKTFEKTLIEGQGRTRWAFCEFAACVLRQGFPAVSFGTCCSTQKACTPHQAMAQERHNTWQVYIQHRRGNNLFIYLFSNSQAPHIIIFFFVKHRSTFAAPVQSKMTGSEALQFNSSEWLFWWQEITF